MGAVVPPTRLERCATSRYNSTSQRPLRYVYVCACAYPSPNGPEQVHLSFCRGAKEGARHTAILLVIDMDRGERQGCC